MSTRVTQDDQRVNFLLALDRSDEVDLHGFEAEFVESNLDRFNFSDKQRIIIDKLIAKYEIAIGWNPDNTRLAARQIAKEARGSTRARAVAGARAGGRRAGCTARAVPVCEENNGS